MSLVKTFPFNPLQVNTYLIYQSGGPGILIDPAFTDDREFRILDEFVRINDTSIVLILNTHGHFDHTFGIRRAREEYGARFLISEADVPFLQFAREQASAFGFRFDRDVGEPDGFLHDGDRLTEGPLHLEVIEVPGHSPGSVAFWQADRSRVFTGDTLFAGGIGRTDLPGGDYRQIMDSIRNRLLTLPGGTAVYPGHGPDTTIDAELESNPFL